jgi:hypothetical protein
VTKCLIHTRVFEATDVWALRKLVAALLPELSWRRHGTGALQGYVHENPEHELRVHLWSPALVLPGIQESGVAHNHRFAMHSRVLHGAIQHAEWQLESGDDFVLYDFVHARLHTEGNRAEMRALPERFDAVRVPIVIRAGQSYTFDRGAYHDSAPASQLAVTLVEKFDQRDERACVIAPANKPPVPAFGGGEPPAWLVARIVEEARIRLLGDG